MANFEERKGLQKKVSSLFKDVPIPQDNGEKQAPGEHEPNHIPGNFPNHMYTDRPISQSSLIKKINQVQESLNKAPAGQSDDIFPKPISAGHQVSQDSPSEQPELKEESSDKIETDQSVDIFPKPASDNHQIEQNPFVKVVNQDEESSDKIETEQSVDIFPKPMSADHQIEQNPFVKVIDQDEDLSDKIEPAQTSNDSPKPTPAGHQEPRSSLIKTLTQSEDTSDKAESEQPSNGFPKLTPPNHQVPRSSLIKTLNQADDSKDKTEPESPKRVFPKPKLANHQTHQAFQTKKTPQSEESPREEAPSKKIRNEPFIEISEGGFLQRIKDKLLTPKPGSSPAKQKALVVMVPVLMIVMIFVLRQVISKSPDKTRGATKDDGSVKVANADSGIEIAWQIPEPLPAITRDPIKLPGQDPPTNDGQNGNQGEGPEGQNVTTIETNPVSIKVQDIVYSKDKPSAFIASKIVYVGDKVDGVTIVRIERDRVEFEKNGKRWVQKIRE